MYRPQYLNAEYEQLKIYSENKMFYYTNGTRTCVKSGWKRKPNNKINRLYGRKKPR